MPIAYKEALETKYYLSILKDANYIEKNLIFSYHLSVIIFDRLVFSFFRS